MKKANQNLSANQISDALKAMSRDDIRAVATKLNVPRGKEKANTVANLTKAINEGKARFTLQFTIRTNDDPSAKLAPAVFSMKLRTHKDNKIVVPAPVIEAKV